MTSIYRLALGDDFERLHPQIRRRFGFSSADRIASIGTGVMERLWHGPAYTLPFLYVGAWRHIMLPETGRNVPFTIENYAYVDHFGRETVTWLRTFKTWRSRRFDAYMIYSHRRGLIVDYLGSHQHLAVELHLSVDEAGGLCIRSGAQRFYEGRVAFSFPLVFSGVAEVREWYDDRAETFRIAVAVRNDRWGPLFGYAGHFQVDWRPQDPARLPAGIRPLREEIRE
ncbi:MAG: DUF4166 domain-containing protein [Chloroflexi bacterium]|nr:DUF4166 domain-containing protein [Chloroflexota bacterium]